LSYSLAVEGFSFRNFLVDAFTIFVFVVTIWLLITVFMDLFRRHDISGRAKAAWVIGLIIFPLLAVLKVVGWPSAMSSKLSKPAMSSGVSLASAPLTR
jgi:NADH:ubiquinone oxidoreductase subunit 6 (subunit J)